MSLVLMTSMTSSVFAYTSLSSEPAMTTALATQAGLSYSVSNTSPVCFYSYCKNGTNLNANHVSKSQIIESKPKPTDIIFNVHYNYRPNKLNYGIYNQDQLDIFLEGMKQRAYENIRREVNAYWYVYEEDANFTDRDMYKELVKRHGDFAREFLVEFINDTKTKYSNNQRALDQLDSNLLYLNTLDNGPTAFLRGSFSNRINKIN